MAMPQGLALQVTPVTAAPVVQAVLPMEAVAPVAQVETAEMRAIGSFLSDRHGRPGLGTLAGRSANPMIKRLQNE